MLRPEDKAMLESKGIPEAQVEAQLERFRSGFPYLALVGAARPGQGIKVLDHESEESAIARWKEYLAHGGEVTKFVPASCLI